MKTDFKGEPLPLHEARDGGHTVPSTEIDVAPGRPTSNLETLNEALVLALSLLLMYLLVIKVLR